jgi:Uma2 family endonuclease
MVLQTKPITIDTFRAYVSRSENSDRLFELIDGEMIEVSPGRTSNSGIGHQIVLAVHPFCEQHDIPCYTSGGDGAYDIQGNVVAPDFAFKRTPLSNEYPDPIAPDWVVEVISPTDKPYEIRAKRQIYLRAKILYWELYPESQSIDVYAPGQPQPRMLGIDDTLDGGHVLPGFMLPVKKLFKK